MQVRFCGLTLDKPLAKVLQHCQDDWKDWAKGKREKHLQWRKQVEELDQQSQQQSSKGSKKGKARAGKKPPSKAPALTAEENLQMLDDDKKVSSDQQGHWGRTHAMAVISSPPPPPSLPAVPQAVCLLASARRAAGIPYVL
jgi:hypothetical protein